MEVSSSVKVLRAARERLSDLGSETAMLRVLASLGTQMSVFVHEINALLGMAEALDTAVARTRQDISSSSAQRRAIAQLHGTLGDLRRSLERQSAYLVDIVAQDARRRRTRQSLSPNPPKDGLGDSP